MVAGFEFTDLGIHILDTSVQTSKLILEGLHLQGKLTLNLVDFVDS